MKSKFYSKYKIKNLSIKSFWVRLGKLAIQIRFISPAKDVNKEEWEDDYEKPI